MNAIRSRRPNGPDSDRSRRLDRRHRHTNIAIYLRDGEPRILDRIAALDDALAISVITQVELEGGVDRIPAIAARRRIKLDELIATVEVLPFGPLEAATYGVIVAARGYSRSRILDRMIAASAIVRGVPLITLDAADFRDIPGLALTNWAP